MPGQSQIFERAADCERASQAATNQQEKIALRVLRDLWTALANESPFLSDEQIRKEIIAIEQLHAAALRVDPTTVPMRHAGGAP